MTQQVVTVEEFLARFDELLGFVCAEEERDNEVVIVRPDGESVVLVPQGRYVAVRLALGTHQTYVRQHRGNQQIT